MTINGIFMHWYAEQGARGKDYEDLIYRLQENEGATFARMLHASDIGLNRKRAAHVIGIERWGAQRMRTLLGEPLVMDEYDGYAPSADLDMEKLATEFKRTRAATIALVCELEAKGVSLSQKAKHNELGDLSAGGWLVYLSSHTGRETLTLLPRLHSKANKAVEL